jgi:YfiH family protein
MVSRRNNPSWIAAEWDAPDRVKAGVTTRIGGCSYSPFTSLNLATHVGDDGGAVTRNRQHISATLALPSEPVWLDQIHGDRLISAENSANKTADGIYTDQAGVVCVIMTADCVPVMLCNEEGSLVAAVHIGWKGLCAGILDNALRLFKDRPAGLHVWIGPHIGSRNYEVGNDVRDACLAKDPELVKAFEPNPRGRWQANLEGMIRHQLHMHGSKHIASANRCTFAESDLFYSYRRDGQTGRMASMIWIERPA